MMRHVAERLHDNCTTFHSVQILDLHKTKIEVFIENSEYWLIHYGKNTDILGNGIVKIWRGQSPLPYRRRGCITTGTPYPW